MLPSFAQEILLGLGHHRKERGAVAHCDTTLEPEQLRRRRDKVQSEWLADRFLGGLELDWRAVWGWIGGGLAWIGVDWRQPRPNRDLRSHEFLPTSLAKTIAKIMVSKVLI